MKSIVEAKLEYNRRQLKKFIKARNKSAIRDYNIRCHLLEDIIEDVEQISTWKDKLEALIDGLEIENKEKLLNDGNVETYKMLGEVMAYKIKQMQYWR